MLILHIACALIGIILAATGLFRPSRHIIHAALGFTAVTVVSGVGLSIYTGGSLTSACLTGLVYSVGILTMVGLINHRLADEKIRIDKLR